MNDFVATIDNKKKKINFSDFNKLVIDNETFNYQVDQLSEQTFKVTLDNKIYILTKTNSLNGDYVFLVDGHYFDLSVKTAVEEKAALLLNQKNVKDTDGKIFSPMPGLIVKLYKKVGEEIKQGDPIILLEAMKMENEILATKTGIIKEIKVQEGVSVEKKQLLVVIN